MVNRAIGHATERTPWFRWPERPAREGWYEFNGFMIEGVVMKFWNGNQWGTWEDGFWTHLADCATDRWRGLTETGLHSFIEGNHAKD